MKAQTATAAVQANRVPTWWMVHLAQHPRFVEGRSPTPAQDQWREFAQVLHSIGCGGQPPEFLRDVTLGELAELRAVLFDAAQREISLRPAPHIQVSDAVAERLGATMRRVEAEELRSLPMPPASHVMDEARLAVERDARTMKPE